MAYFRCVFKSVCRARAMEGGEQHQYLASRRTSLGLQVQDLFYFIVSGNDSTGTERSADPMQTSWRKARPFILLRSTTHKRRRRKWARVGQMENFKIAFRLGSREHGLKAPTKQNKSNRNRSNELIRFLFSMLVFVYRPRSLRSPRRLWWPRWWSRWRAWLRAETSRMSSRVWWSSWCPRRSFTNPCWICSKR